MTAPAKVSARTPLDASQKQSCQYCIPIWLRNEQIKLAIARPIPRIEGAQEKRSEPIALVNFGPSLHDTWEQLRGFKYVMSCSGAHRFLIDHGIVPTWHVEVDPRKHKIQLLGEPHPDVEYLIASACHPDYFDHLAGYNVRLWHVFDNKDDAIRTLPHGEWALPGGCSVGLRTMTIARFFGFTDQHIFGMDGCARESGTHTLAHPNAPKALQPCEYNGVTYMTTPSMLEAARGTWHELNQMPDVVPTFYGDGLVQAMAKDYTPEPVGKGKAMIGFAKPELISAEYRGLNAQLHRENLAYGVGGGRHAPAILKLTEDLKTTSVLDYGAGKRYLGKALPFPIWEYDPAFPEISASPRPADIVACCDVLEHIEPEKLHLVLDDLARVTKKLGYFVIHTGPAQKTLPDGRNTHLLQHGKGWWASKLDKHFQVAQIVQKGLELHCFVGPKPGQRKLKLLTPTGAVQAAVG